MKKAISTKTLLFLKTLFITLIIVAPNKASALFNSATFASSTVTLGGYNMIISGQIESLNSSLSAINVALSPGSFFTLISADKKDFAITVSGVSSHTKTCSTNNSSIVFTSPASMSTSSISISGNCAGIVSSPLQITAVSGTAGDSSASISWTAPSDGGSPITDYIIEYKSSGAATYAIFNDGINTNTSATISSLSNGTSYNFRVTALNAIGLSASSSIVSITPVAAVSNGGGGGGGGGGSYYIPPIIIPAATNTKASSTNPTSTPVVTITPTTTINKNIVTPISILLYPNIIHPEVKTLQIFLNSNGYTIAISGPSSKGNETSYMSPATVIALKKFQRNNSILANGYVGIATRNKINSLLK